MPVTERKNRLYAAALPLLGRRCRWRHAQTVNGGDAQTLRRVERVMKRHRVVGGCVQVIRGGELAGDLQPPGLLRCNLIRLCSRIRCFARRRSPRRYAHFWCCGCKRWGS